MPCVGGAHDALGTPGCKCRGGAILAAWPMTGFTALHSQLGRPDFSFSLFSVDTVPSPRLLAGLMEGRTPLFSQRAAAGLGPCCISLALCALMTFKYTTLFSTRGVVQKAVLVTPRAAAAPKSCVAGAALLGLPVLVPPALRRVRQAAGEMVTGGQGFLKR